MKILDRSQLGIGGAGLVDGSGPAEAVTGRQGAAGAGAAGGVQDRAEVSGLAGKLAEAATLEESRRANRVEHLRAAVASGAYQVEPAKVSRGVVDEALARDGALGNPAPTPGAASDRR